MTARVTEDGKKQSDKKNYTKIEQKEQNLEGEEPSGVGIQEGGEGRHGFGMLLGRASSRSVTVDAYVLVQVIGAREALGAVGDGAFEGLLEGVDGPDVALEVLGALEDLAAIVEAALEDLAARVVWVA